MKLAACVLAAFTLSACAGDAGPHAPAGSNVLVPTPGSTAKAFLWGMIVNDSGVCIEGATMRVVAGQRAGESIKQTTPCNAWSYGAGFWFTELTPGVEMTLRASAPGYVDEERTVTPTLGGQTAMLFAPRRQFSMEHD